MEWIHLAQDRDRWQAVVNATELVLSCHGCLLDFHQSLGTFCYVTIN
jgi:hypothetical protein